MNITLRQIKKSDSKQLLKLITELAKFEKLKPPSLSAQKRLINDIFKKNSNLKVLVAENQKGLIAYAFYFFTYSTFLAKPTLYLEDIYISSEYQKYGIGTCIFKELLKIAMKYKCGRIEFIVLKWNKNAIKFYKKFNARELKDWKFFRINI